MSVSVILLLLALPMLLAGSGFFSGSETALFSLSRHQRKRFAASGSVAGATITNLLAETRGLLITLMLGNMLFNVLYINISTLMLLRLSRALDLGAAVTTALNVAPLVAVILLGEVLPKIVAAHTAARWSRMVALPLWAVHRLLTPVRVASSVLVITPLSRLLAPREAVPELSATEMEALLALSEAHGVIDSEEEGLLQQVLELGQLKVRDLMTLRVDIEAFDIHDQPGALMELIQRTRLRHIPVYEGQLDHVVGMIFSRQALVRVPRTRGEVGKLVRQVKFVPEQQRADRLLGDLRKTGTTVAMVVDEYGGTAGLITIEDVAEHLVGEIPGAYDKASGPAVEAVGPGQWRVRADLSVREWIAALGGSAATASEATLGAVNTVGGLVMARLGRLPREGERIEAGNLVMTVEKMQGRRIQTVRLELSERGKGRGGGA